MGVKANLIIFLSGEQTGVKTIFFNKIRINKQGWGKAIFYNLLKFN